MMAVKNVLKKIAVIMAILTCFTLVGLQVSAATPQENPDTATMVFSGISLFQFYSSTLDSVLTKNQKDIETAIQKSPFANIPPAVEDSFHYFLSSAGNLCSQILELDGSISDTEMLLQESRFTEAAAVKSAALQNLAAANANLNDIEQAVDIAGNQFQVNAAPDDSAISLSYAAVKNNIQQLTNLLDLYQSLLLAQQQEILNESMLPSSDITINITPKSAYVGDTVNVGGTLSANGQPLGNRDIEILLNGSQYLTLTTDSQGNYLSPLQLPYWYVSTIQIQAFYYPQAGDIGAYDLALSPAVNLNILFYQAVLSLKASAQAYPGRDTVIVGHCDYGASPIPDTRNVEVSLDNGPVAELVVAADFSANIALPSDITVGNHLITVSVMADGRYGPAVIDTILNVVPAIPVVLTAKLPFVAFIPGRFSIRGKLTSSVGPVAQAGISITFDGKQVHAISNDDGTFFIPVSSDIGFGLFGSQTLQFTVTPSEPWPAAVTLSRKVMTVYAVNCGVFFLILVLLGIILPRRLKFSIRPSAKQKLPQSVIATQSAFSATAASNVADNNSNDIDFPDKNSPAGRLFYWYRIVIRLVQKVSGLLLQPHQTLREYLDDTVKATGAAGKIILEFTRIVEMVLYSSHQVTDNDIKNGEQLARKVRENIGK